MKLKIEINCDNDSFVDDEDGVVGEIAFILTKSLRQLDESLEDGSKTYKSLIFDSNGSEVGVLEYFDNNKIKEISEEEATLAGII